MPIIYRYYTCGEDAVPRYSWPAQYVTPTKKIYDFLISYRKEVIANQNYFRSCMNSTDDREYKKLFKSFIKENLRFERAITLALPYFGGNEEIRNDVLWPLELVFEMD